MSAKAAKASQPLTRMTTDVKGPKYIYQLLLAVKVKSILSYAYSEPIKGKFGIPANRDEVVAYRVASNEEVRFIEGMICLDLLANEARYVYQKRRMKIT